MRFRAFAFAVILLARAEMALAAGPTSSMLAPVSTATMGESVFITLNLEGVPDSEVSATLFYRGRSANAWGSAPLEAKGGGRFQGVIPTTATADLAVRYYVKASGPMDSWQLSFGSSKSPLSIDLLEAPASAPSTLWFKLGLLLSLALAGSGFIWLRERRRRNQVLDRSFWMKTLGPLYGIPGPRLAQEIRRLCGTPLAHPVKGLTIFPRATITSKLYEVGLWNEKELERDLALFAPEMKLSVASQDERIDVVVLPRGSGEAAARTVTVGAGAGDPAPGRAAGPSAARSGIMKARK